jgi:hypothetical protein
MDLRLSGLRAVEEVGAGINEMRISEFGLWIEMPKLERRIHESF